MLYVGIEELVNRAEAPTGKDELPADLRIAAAHEAEEFNLLLGVWREIGMAAFGGHNAVAGAVPNEDGLSETGAGSKERAGSAILGLAGIENAVFLGSEMLDAVTGSAKIVHQDDVSKFQLAC
jgi:hypothetical protein